MTVADIYTLLMITIGLFFFFAGSLGLWRFPDSLCRLHALTKADNLGLGFIVLGVLPQLNKAVDGIQLILIWLLVMFCGAVTSYLVANQLLESNEMAEPVAAADKEHFDDHD